MAIKGHSTLLRPPELKMQFSAILRTSLLVGIQSAYSKPCWQSECVFWVGVLPLSRGYNQHILSLSEFKWRCVHTWVTYIIKWWCLDILDVSVVILDTFWAVVCLGVKHRIVLVQHSQYLWKLYKFSSKQFLWLMWYEAAPRYSFNAPTSSNYLLFA